MKLSRFDRWLTTQPEPPEGEQPELVPGECQECGYLHDGPCPLQEDE